MKTMYDVQQLLKRFGTFIYTGDRIGDLELIEFEINELYQSQFIHTTEFNMCKLIIKKEKTRLLREKG